uniref:Uncharacterized protein n=1 Tax=Anguilla anguilla TaxID=7936 RepID=A0A0E9RQN2_ANGAN
MLVCDPTQISREGFYSERNLFQSSLAYIGSKRPSVGQSAPGCGCRRFSSWQPHSISWTTTGGKGSAHETVSPCVHRVTCSLSC